MASAKPRKPRVILVPAERIERSILLIRGQKVLLDRDLADLYAVETRVLIQAVNETSAGFPQTSCSSSRQKNRNNGDHSL